jgi:hypothetical protein
MSAHPEALRQAIVAAARERLRAHLAGAERVGAGDAAATAAAEVEAFVERLRPTAAGDDAGPSPASKAGNSTVGTG